MPNITVEELKAIRNSYKTNSQSKSFHDSANLLFPDSSQYIAFNKYFSNRIRQAIEGYKNSSDPEEARIYKAQAIADIMTGYKEVAKKNNISEQQQLLNSMNIVKNEFGINQEQFNTLSNLVSLSDEEVHEYDGLELNENGEMDEPEQKVDLAVKVKENTNSEVKIEDENKLESTVKFDKSSFARAFGEYSNNKRTVKGMSHIEDYYNERNAYDEFEIIKSRRESKTIKNDTYFKKEIAERTKSIIVNDAAKYMAMKDVVASRSMLSKILLFPRTIYEAIKLNGAKNKLINEYNMSDKQIKAMDNAVENNIDIISAESCFNDVGSIEFNTKTGAVKEEQKNDIAIDNKEKNSHFIDQKEFQNKLGNETNEISNKNVTKEQNVEQTKTKTIEKGVQ